MRRLLFVLLAVSRGLELEEQLVNLQLRAGALTSFKKDTLAQSPWEIGPLERGPRQKTLDIGFYRVIGSPLPPRHNASQLWNNLKYLLETEPPLERARKIFVLNRLPTDLNAHVKTYLESRGFETMTIPLDLKDYGPFQMTDTYGLKKERWYPHLTDKFARLNARLFVMNNNGARNYALRSGLKRGFTWTLPFDGNCIFDLKTWKSFLTELDAAEKLNLGYVAIPLLRTVRDMNGTLVRNGQPGEHQIAFGRSAKLQFDPTQPYGHRPKVNLLWRLGVPGGWDKWTRDAPFRSQGPCVMTSHHDCLRTLPHKDVEESRRSKVSETVVYRLPDGLQKPGLSSGEDTVAFRGRGELRDMGTIRKIALIDTLHPSAHVKPFVKPVYFNVVSMETMRRECSVTKAIFEETTKESSFFPSPVGSFDQHHCSQIEDLIQLAHVHLRDEPYTVVDKEKSPDYRPPEGATSHDYQRLGLYDWRIAELPSSVNVPDLRIPPVLAGATNKDLHDPLWRAQHANVFVGWDGHGRNGADIWAEGSEVFDRTRSYDMMTNLTLNALAYFYSGNHDFAEKAARIARVWFVDRETAQSPNMNYAQFSKRPEKAHFGVIATKDLAYTFDALWLITPTKFWTDHDDRLLQNWCSDYLSWLDKSNERKSPNNHGWYYLTQYLAVAKCAGRPDNFSLNKLNVHVLKFVTEDYITPDGVFTLEAERSRGVHYHFFTAYSIILAYRALSNLGAKDLMHHISHALRPFLVFADDIVSRPSDKTCLSYDEEFGTRRRLQNFLKPKPPTTTKEPTIQGCVPRAVALEYAAPVCQYAFDDNATFANTLTMCKNLPGSKRLAHEPPYPYLGTQLLNNYIVPPFMPTNPHMGYFPFTNLMW